MLRNGESAEGPIEGASCVCHERLLHQKLEIHLPYPRHLVEEDQCPLEEAVDLLVLGGEDGGIELRNVFRPKPEILATKSVWYVAPWGESSGTHHLPKLIGSRELHTGALHDIGLLLDRPMLKLVLDIGKPWLRGTGVTDDVLFVGKVLLALPVHSRIVSLYSCSGGIGQGGGKDIRPRRGLGDGRRRVKG